MRENRLSGSEGGGTEANQFLLPLFKRQSREEHFRKLVYKPMACAPKVD